MGCLDQPGWYRNNKLEVPPFNAVLSPYYIGKYEVKNDEYNYFVSENGYQDSTLWSKAGWKYIKEKNLTRPIDWIEGPKPWIKCPYANTADSPISFICWYEAEAYCNWLCKKTGEKFSLPTEAQWERAARGPDPGRIFPWGNEDDQTKLNNALYTHKICPVGCFEKGKSYDGCYDMAGNVMEFCRDWFELYIYETYKKKEPVFNPAGPDTNEYNLKSLRGEVSLFFNDPEIEMQITTFRRQPCGVEDRFASYGFRIVKNIE
jgi:formylglycine-generating enzyme required for sulfatase activity